MKVDPAGRDRPDISFPDLQQQTVKKSCAQDPETLLHRITPAPLFQGFGVMVAELGRFFGRKILLLIRLQVFLHLPHNMFGLVKVLNIQVCRGAGNLLRMTTLRTEFPLLETIHVGERAARGAPDDEVHINVVIGVIVINKYRRFAEKPGARSISRAGY